MRTYKSTSIHKKQIRKQSLYVLGLISFSVLTSTLITFNVLNADGKESETKPITMSIEQPEINKISSLKDAKAEKEIEIPTEVTKTSTAKTLLIQNEPTKDTVVPDELADIEQQREYEFIYADDVSTAYADSGYNGMPSDVATETETIVASTNDNESASETAYTWSGNVLTPSGGVNYGPQGKETYYNLDMSGVVSIMRGMGFDEENYPYNVRADGCKCLGPYIMVAANLSVFPRGSFIECSLGTALVCDTGGFAAGNPYQLDIATTW